MLFHALRWTDCCYLLPPGSKEQPRNVLTVVHICVQPFETQHPTLLPTLTF